MTHILFDFFGTLVAYSKRHGGHGISLSHQILLENGSQLSYGEFVRRWESTFEKFVRRASASLDEFSMTELCEHFLGSTLPDAPRPGLVADFRDTYLEEWSRGVIYLPALNPMLEKLSSAYQLVVVSNTHHADLVQNHLARAGMAAYFSQVVTSVECGRRKPCATVYAHALSVSRAHASSAIFVGDSYEHDYVGPRAVGMNALLIDPGREHDIPDAHRLEQILDVVGAIGG